MTNDTIEPTLAIAQYVCDMKSSEVPEEAKSAAKLAILDTIGVILAGSQDEAGRLIARYVDVSSSGGPAGIFGTNVRTSPEYAALANGVMAHALDYDDRGHASTQVLPAAFALCERTAATGELLLLSYVVGREVRLQLDEEFDTNKTRQDNRGPGSRGWHATGTLGSFGAAAAAAKVLDLDVPAISSAFGIAASLAGGLIANFGTMTKPLHAGNAARNGVLAATLASEGFNGEPTILSARLGFVEAMCLPGECDPGVVAQNLKSSFHLIERGIQIKPYPSCTGTHPYIESTRLLREKYNLNAESVASIDLKQSRGLIRLFPTDGIECKFSAAYAVAITLLDGTFTQAHCTTECLYRKDVQELLAKTTYSGEWGTNERGIRIVTTNGDVIDDPVVPLRNLTEYGDIRAKFFECAEPVVGRDKASRIEEMVADIEHVSVAELAAQVYP